MCLLCVDNDHDCPSKSHPPFVFCKSMKIVKTTPLQFVSNMSPQLRFWKDTLQYNVTMSVPSKDGEEEGPVFVALEAHGKEIMLQTMKSAQADLGDVMPRLSTPSMALYHSVENLADFSAESEGLELLLGPRTTWYGMNEVWVADPSGFVHAFAEQGSE